ncbi:transcriptional regulator [Ammoniphilus oxalaticus]|uniref:Transcriptional regulator n=1 Tax=Ammoniphilus oxalaticus TaxID=66863 RepID=A0A419SJG6_9BACL|nr:helix-turn-helix domain-containing protein [Ammoniphilus oxalaticus]RKD24079.1 transcriptional regulator [Ammoniphilus oxalaticus]
MDTETLKLTGVLADPTRFSIYQYVVKSHRQVTVQEIAENFEIHPNVARLHLTKLEDVSLLNSCSEKTGRGGRPSRLYSISEQVVNLQFPPRDYQLLAEIAIDTLVSLGDEGQRALGEMGRRFGNEAARRAIENERVNLDASAETKLGHIERLIFAQGLNPELELIDDGTIKFRVHNCTFKETAQKMPDSICQMHQTFLRGMFETFFGDITLIEENSIMGGCKSCDYTIIKLPS